MGLQCGSGNEDCCFKAGTNEAHGSSMKIGGCLMRKYFVQYVFHVWIACLSMCVHLYLVSMAAGEGQLVENGFFFFLTLQKLLIGAIWSFYSFSFFF